MDNGLVQKNQSERVISSLLSIIFLATPQEPAVGTITSSPGCQSAGVAIYILYLFQCYNWDYGL